MPVFDYKCADCGSRFSLLLGVVAQPQSEICPSCQSPSITRLVSRFSRMRSEDELIDALADPTGIGDLEDPKQIGNWMKRVGKEMGEDLGYDFDEVLKDIDSETSETAV